jgi:hypothetical protein
MAPRSARASAPAKTISNAAKGESTTKQRGDAAKRHPKPAPAKLDVPKRWLKDPDREWFIESEPKGKQKSQPHHYTVRRSSRPLLSPSCMLTVPPPAQVACRTKIWSCTCPDFLYRKRRQHSECKHIAEIKKSRRAPDAVHAYALSDETIAQLKEYQKDLADERRGKRAAKEEGGAPAEKAKPEPFTDQPPPPGLPKGCHERHERAVLRGNRRMFEKMTNEEMKHQLRAQDQLITGTRRELVSGRVGAYLLGPAPACRLFFLPGSWSLLEASAGYLFLFYFLCSWHLLAARASVRVGSYVTHVSTRMPCYPIRPPPTRA